MYPKGIRCPEILPSQEWSNYGRLKLEKVYCRSFDLSLTRIPETLSEGTLLIYMITGS